MKRARCRARRRRCRPRARPPPQAGGEPARLEWWQIPAALALIALVIEWLASHRLGLRRLSRRLRPHAAGGAIGHS